jgi:hypothetical protein
VSNVTGNSKISLVLTYHQTKKQESTQKNIRETLVIAPYRKMYLSSILALSTLHLLALSTAHLILTLFHAVYLYKI